MAEQMATVGGYCQVLVVMDIDTALPSLRSAGNRLVASLMYGGSSSCATRTVIIPRCRSIMITTRLASTRKHDIVLECCMASGLRYHRRSVERSHSQLTMFLQYFCMMYDHDENVPGLRCRKPDAGSTRTWRAPSGRSSSHTTQGEKRVRRYILYIGSCRACP